MLDTGVRGRFESAEGEVKRFFSVELSSSGIQVGGKVLPSDVRITGRGANRLVFEDVEQGKWVLKFNAPGKGETWSMIASLVAHVGAPDAYAMVSAVEKRFRVIQILTAGMGVVCLAGSFFLPESQSYDDPVYWWALGLRIVGVILVLVDLYSVSERRQRALKNLVRRARRKG